MSKKLIVLAALAATALVGCDDGSPSAEEEKAYVDDTAGSQTREQLAADEKDLADTLKELQSKDPTVKDVYFSYDENGNKVLHVVREEANGKNNDSVWPMVGAAAAGMAGGYLLAKAMNSSGGYQQYQQANRPLSTQHYDEDERRKKRNYAGSAYNAALLNNNRSAVRSSPQYRQNVNTRVSQWRSSPSSAPPAARSAIQSRASGIMSGGSSARASSHGGSGFGG
jgi:hypothetical protein